MSTPEVTAGLLEPFAYGRGYLERTAPANPAAGAGFTYSVAGGFYARVLAIACQLVTDGTAANRWIEARVTDADGTVWERFGAGVLIPASTTVQLAWSDERGESEWASAGADATPIYMPLPARFLQPTEQLRVAIGNVQAGDQLSSVRLSVERFPEGRRGYSEGRAFAQPAKVR